MVMIKYVAPVCIVLILVSSILDTLGSVSYTHLDVYKRQGSAFAERMKASVH